MSALQSFCSQKLLLLLLIYNYFPSLFRLLSIPPRNTLYILHSNLSTEGAVMSLGQNPYRNIAQNTDIVMSSLKECFHSYVILHCISIQLRNLYA
jgi:hypothetical protein